ncbi:MAG TPA: LysR family transcriptional regulator [Steroidobacteraceae bacterium]|jgi:DNA-binding transcriptional LysR family regulator|nr:LysR family transcriptional regulator [Steroidobacteraceae bacterium]
MNLDLIKSFAVLGEHCHFGDAARRLNISQPSLTKQIRRLEDLLGAPLFRRDRQGTELTAFGRRFLDEVQPVLRHVGSVWKKGRDAARGARGNLAIGFTFSAIEVMSRILIAFQRSYPGVDLFFDDVASDVQITRIAEGALDVGFARMTIGADLAYHPIATDRLSFVFPAQLGEEVVDFESESVRALPFIALQEHMAPGLEKQIQRLFASRGFQPQVTHRVNGSLTVLKLIASGLGVGLMHESTVRGIVPHVGGAMARPVQDPLASWDVGLVWRHDEQNPAVIRFLDTAREMFPGEPNRRGQERIPSLTSG